MFKEVWSFKTRKFKIVCEAEFDAWPDPMVFDDEIIDAIREGRWAVSNFVAFVYLDNTQLGRGSWGEILECASPDENLGIEIFRIDRKNVFSAVRFAILDARRLLDQLDGQSLGIRIRKAKETTAVLPPLDPAPGSS